MPPGAWWPAPSANTGRSVRTRDGWSTIPQKSCATCTNWPRRRWSRRGFAAADLAAVGIANQRETSVLWERSSGRAIGHAIVWQDCRTESLVRDVVARRGPRAGASARDCRRPTISRPASCSGCDASTRVPRRPPHVATCCSEPWTRGWRGT
ncbi:MAG: FGGY family carbohydrate kinase [Halothiobacillaceae bacterium]